MSALVRLHHEAMTEECTCDKLPGCAGIDLVRVDCPEHGFRGPVLFEGRFHTHPLQVSGINRGRHIA